MQEPTSSPLFFLTSTEIIPALTPRKCWLVEELVSLERGDSFLRVNIAPPLDGRYFHLAEEKIDEIVLATRHKNTILAPEEQRPVTVYVCYIKNNLIKDSGQVTSNDVQILFIGEIYKIISEANTAIRDQINRI